MAYKTDTPFASNVMYQIRLVVLYSAIIIFLGSQTHLRIDHSNKEILPKWTYFVNHGQWEDTARLG